MKTHDTCTPVFITTVFITTKTWNNLNAHQQKMDKDVVHIYKGTLLSHNKEQNVAIHNNMDGPRYHIE